MKYAVYYYVTNQGDGRTMRLSAGHNMSSSQATQISNHLAKSPLVHAVDMLIEPNEERWD